MNAQSDVLACAREAASNACAWHMHSLMRIFTSNRSLTISLYSGRCEVTLHGIQDM